MTQALHTLPRLFVESPLNSGVSLILPEGPSHYLAHVMRAQTGEEVRLFNGRDGEWLARVTEIGKSKKSGVTLLVTNQRRPQTSEPDLWLCAAPIKKAHFDYLIEKATELGVSVIQPVLTSRTQIRDVNTVRAQALATEAAEQSERLSVPTIRPALTLEKLIQAWPKDRLPILCAELGESVPIGSALTANASLAGSPAAFLTGPEGGFTMDERKALDALPRLIAVRLGPRILRADTAALAALSCWQSFCGDWREPVSPRY